MKKGLFIILTCLLLSGAPAADEILFVRGGDRTGGFLEGRTDAERTEHLCDIFNTSTSGGNHGWAEFRQALEGAGYTATQITEGSETNSGPATGIPIDFTSMDLNQYEVVIMGSNNTTYESEQVDAIENYIRGGGSVVFISDANFGSSWADAPDSDQHFLDRFGLVMNQDLGTYSLQRSENDFIVPDHPIFENVDRFDGEGVSPGHIANVPNDVTVTRLAKARGDTRVNTPPFGGNMQGSPRGTDNNDGSLIVGEAGAGRFAIHFDRNTFFNLNGAGTNINRFDNERYALNLVAWLAAAGGATFTQLAETLPQGQDGPLDDADADGSINLIEHALGTSPLVSNPSPLISSFDGDQLEIQFPIRAAATDVGVVVEISETLAPASWTTNGVTTEPLSRSLEGIVTMRATTTTGAGAPRLFIRLRVTQLP